MKYLGTTLLFAGLTLGIAACGDGTDSSDLDVISTESQGVGVHRMKVLQYISAYSHGTDSNLNDTGPGWQLNIDNCELLPEPGDYGQLLFDCTDELERTVAAEWQTSSPIPLMHRLIYGAVEEQATGRHFARMACNLMEIDVAIDDVALGETDGVGFHYRDNALGDRAAGRFLDSDQLYVAHETDAGAGNTTLRFLAVSSCYTDGSGSSYHSVAELKPFYRLGDTDYWEQRQLNHQFPTPTEGNGYEIYP